MARRALLIFAAVMFGVAVVSAGVVAVGVVRLIVGLPAVEKGVERIADLQTWGHVSWVSVVAGFVALWFVRDPSGKTGAEADCTPDQDSAG